MEIDLPLYSPDLTSVCNPAFAPSLLDSAFRLPSCHPAADADACSAVKCEDEDFLKDILDLPDSLSPPDSGCHTGQSTPAYRGDFSLVLSPPSSPLEEADEEVDGESLLPASASVMQTAGLAEVADDDNDDVDDDNDDDADDTDSASDFSAAAAAACGISDYELVALSIKDLNARLRHLPKARVLQLKHRRRTLKNRQYAHVCRLRRQKTQAELASESVGMAKQIASLRQQLERASRERDLYRDELRRVQQHLLQQRHPPPPLTLPSFSPTPELL